MINKVLHFFSDPMHTFGNWDSGEQPGADERLSPFDVYVTATRIFGFLSPAELACAVRVCRAWNETAQEMLNQLREAETTLLLWEKLARQIDRYQDTLSLYAALNTVQAMLDKAREFSSWKNDHKRAFEELVAKDTLKVWKKLADAIHAAAPDFEDQSISVIDKAKGFSQWMDDNTQELNCLTYLDLKQLDLTSLPESICQLTNLEGLYLDGNLLTALPKSIGQLAKLKRLFIAYNQLTSIPESIGKLSNLYWLKLSKNRLTSLPESVGQLSNLKKLDVHSNQLTSIPVDQLINLKSLNVAGNPLISILESINQFTLKSLGVDNNQLTSIIESIDPRVELKVYDYFAWARL